MFVKKRIDTLDGLIIRGVGRLGVYFRNNIFISKWMSLYPGGGLKTGGGFNMGFYSMLSLQSNKQILQTDLLTFRYRIGYERI